MRQVLALSLVVAGVAVLLLVPRTSRAGKQAEPKVRFVPLHIYLDSGDTPLAAYQFELVCSVPVRAYSPGEDNASRRHDQQQVKIVGVEGGEHPAFKEAPYYDPAALMNDRIIIATFNTGKDLPTGRTRVATIHLQIPADAEPHYRLKLVVAADTQGQSLDATLSTERGVRQ